ncbi:MAG: carbon-nitrogen hydrolase family protein [Armatimonadota bacterium]|nr:carbon-nitrogen hydrolase family protein [Armatimonadota bacterium]
MRLVELESVVEAEPGGGDRLPRVKVAAVQAAPVFLNRERTTERACEWILEAGRRGAKLVVFPEGFIPGHPLWYHFYPATDPRSGELATRLFLNSVEIPSRTTEALCESAREAGVYVIMGLCERRPGTFGTLYNTQLFIAPDGTLLGKHRKLVPTVGERLVHTGGFGDTLRTFPTDFGRVGGLICGESSNPLAVFALMAEYPHVLAVSWPNRFPKRGMSCPERALVVGRALALATKAFVVNACGTLTDEMRELLVYTEEDRAILWDDRSTGGSNIVGPGGSVVAGPMGAEEGVLVFQADLNECVAEKVRHDFAGHYNRPDVFQLRVNASAPRIYVREGEGEGAEGR